MIACTFAPNVIRFNKVHEIGTNVSTNIDESVSTQPKIENQLTTRLQATYYNTLE